MFQDEPAMPLELNPEALERLKATCPPGHAPGPFSMVQDATGRMHVVRVRRG
jgi:hypothetical protein